MSDDAGDGCVVDDEMSREPGTRCRWQRTSFPTCKLLHTRSTHSLRLSPLSFSPSFDKNFLPSLFNLVLTSFHHFHLLTNVYLQDSLHKPKRCIFLTALFLSRRRASLKKFNLIHPRTDTLYCPFSSNLTISHLGWFVIWVNWPTYNLTMLSQSEVAFRRS